MLVRGDACAPHTGISNAGGHTFARREASDLLDKLEFLLALARQRHFGKAADECGVTQPTLSAGLKQLEEALGVLLVKRGSRFQGFTPEGERVLEWARRIVGDTRAMRQEINALRHGLAGQLRIACVPTAVAAVAALTTPYHVKHPNVEFTIVTRTSTQVLALLENLEIDAGITYLDNEPLGRLNTVPLYRERFHLLTAARAKLGDRDQVTWSELADVPLCLLTADTQTRRIIDGLLKGPQAERRPTLESDSMILLAAHVRTGHWASIIPARIADALAPHSAIRSIPIMAPETVYTIGLVVPTREPMTPLLAALVAEARRIAATPA
jgi:DNA-binding transcriptional LysR family regulator